MLQYAEQKRVYHSLHHGDLTDYLTEPPQTLDAITCAATLIQFGDLKPAFQAAATSLRHGAIFVATLFPNNDLDRFRVGALDGLGQGGCFVSGVAVSAGSSVEIMEEHVHEFVSGKPIHFSIVSFARQFNRVRMPPSRHQDVQVPFDTLKQPYDCDSD